MLNGKTLVITGATRGIGKAIALRFAKLGVNIVMNYRQERPKKLIEELESNHIKVFSQKCDVSNFEECEDLVKNGKNVFGSIDILINNAGITKDNLLIRMSPSEFNDVLHTNLTGTFNMTRHVSNFMVKQKSGCIINISSIVGITGNPGQSNYASSKAGIIGFTRSIAKELASRSIVCNAIAPGFIQTDMTEVLPDKTKSAILDKIPLNRFGDPDEVAQLCVFLSTCKYITGQVLNIDGGMLLG